MVTKEQAIDAGETRVYFHFRTDCKHKWRSNGKCKTWKTRPNAFRLPIKFGLYGHGYVEESNAEFFHLASECPLLKEQS